MQSTFHFARGASPPIPNPNQARSSATPPPSPADLPQSQTGRREDHCRCLWASSPQSAPRGAPPLLSDSERTDGCAPSGLSTKGETIMAAATFTASGGKTRQPMRRPRRPSNPTGTPAPWGAHPPRPTLRTRSPCSCLSRSSCLRYHRWRGRYRRQRKPSTSGHRAGPPQSPLTRASRGGPAN